MTFLNDEWSITNCLSLTKFYQNYFTYEKILKVRRYKYLSLCHYLQLFSQTSRH